MFSANTYAARRAELCRRIGKERFCSRIMPSPNNYPNNAYYFRQDSTFLYFFGLNMPSMVGVIDAETGEATLYGDDFTVEDIIWTGPQPAVAELGAQVGVTKTAPLSELAPAMRKAVTLNRRVHYLPPYRGESKMLIASLLGRYRYAARA